LLLGERRFGDAREAAEAAAAAFPDDPAIEVALADAWVASGRISKAVATLKADPSLTAAKQLRLAQLLIRDGQTRAAVKILRGIGELDSAEALFAGQLLLDAREPLAAAERLKLVAHGGGDARDYYGFALLLAGEYTQSAAVLLPAAHDRPQVATLHCYAGSALRLSGDGTRLPQSEVHLRQATELSPREAIFQYELALARVQLRDLKGARAAMEQAAAMAPDSPEIQRDLARIYDHAGEGAPAALARARYLRLVDDPAGAARELQPWVSRSPNDVDLVLALSAAFHDAGKFAQATDLVERLRRQEPKNTEVLWSQFRLRSALKQHDRALLTLADLERETPKDPLVLDERATTLQHLARHAEAEKILEELCTPELQTAERHYRLGVLRSLWSQRPDAQQAAEASYRKALELRPEYAEAHQALGKLLVGAGRTAEAIPYFRRALDLAPAYPDALRALGRAYLAAGDKSRSDDEFTQFRQVEARLKERERKQLPVRQLRDVHRSRTALYEFYLGAGDEKAAIRELEALIHAFPDDRPAHAVLEGLYGHARRFQRQFEEREWLRRHDGNKPGRMK
jgi:tetratricopeptide (TPR) repeat protein